MEDNIVQKARQIIGENFLHLLENSDIRTLIDDRSEKIGKKIRDAEVIKTPYMLIIGETEEKDGTVSVRKHGEGDKGSQSIDNFIKNFKFEIENSLEKFKFN